MASAGVQAATAASRIAPFAASLSLLLPGLGQVALGRRRRGFLLAIPAMAIALVVAATAASVAADPTAALDLVPGPEVLPALLILGCGLLAWHLTAIIDAERLARMVRPVRGWRRLPAALLLAALLLAGAGVHATIGYLEVQSGVATGVIFGPGGDGGDDGNGAWAIPDTSFEPEPTDEPSLAPGPTPAPTPPPSGMPGATMPATAAPTPTPAIPTPAPTAPPAPTPTPKPVPAWARDGRLNLLLIGSDAGPDRWSLRTDTIIVLSVDVKTHRAALLGIPRNMVGVPLPPESAGATRNGHFPGLLNALYVYAMGHPDEFPGGDARGMRAVSGAVQELLGVRLDGMVVVNLAGFVSLVDELGGLWIDIPARLVDNRYPVEDGSRLMRVTFDAGCQKLGGRMALAYARSRHQDSDYGRMRRQQTVLLALRRGVDPVALVPKVPALLKIARDNLWTTLKRQDLRDLARLAAEVDVRRVARVLFVPSKYPSHLTEREIAKIRHVARTIFEEPLPSPDRSLADGHCP
jgi:LCP family protein required for cell wall assembly